MMKTKKFKSQQADLARDIESYRRGEVPSAHTMIQAPRLDYWEAHVRRRGAEYVLVVHGDVQKHPEIADGEPIQTSAVTWFDRKGRFIRTSNRVYALGKPDIIGGIRQ